MFSLSTSSQHHTFPFVVPYLVHYILLQFSKIATVSQQVGLISSPAVDYFALVLLIGTLPLDLCGLLLLKRNADILWWKLVQTKNNEPWVDVDKCCMNLEGSFEGAQYLPGSWMNIWQGKLYCHNVKQKWSAAEEPFGFLFVLLVSMALHLPDQEHWNICTLSASCDMLILDPGNSLT